MLAFGLPTKNAPCLLGLATPLTMTVGKRWGHHFLNLLVGIGVGAGGELVKSIPSRRDREIDHRTSHIEQLQSVRLDFVRQTQRIAQGLLITACAHFKSSFCL